MPVDIYILVHFDSYGNLQLSKRRFPIYGIGIAIAFS